MRLNRESNQRLAEQRIHKAVKETLAQLWKQYGQNPNSPNWINAHTKTVNQWRKEGEKPK